MKGWVVYSTVVSVIAVGAIGVAVGFAVSGATGHSDPKVEATAIPTTPPTPAPTEYVPRLTGTEAAAKAKSVFTALPGPTTSDALRRQLYGMSCSATDFNQRDLAWDVVCKVPDSATTFTLKVADATGQVTVISP